MSTRKEGTGLRLRTRKGRDCDNERGMGQDCDYDRGTDGIVITKEELTGL